MEFVPEVHQHSAGLILYYDNMNYINLRKYYSENSRTERIVHHPSGKWRQDRIFEHQDPGRGQNRSTFASTSKEENPGSSGATTEKIMRRSDASSIPQILR